MPEKIFFALIILCLCIIFLYQSFKIYELKCEMDRRSERYFSIIEKQKPPKFNLFDKVIYNKQEYRVVDSWLDETYLIWKYNILTQSGEQEEYIEEDELIKKKKCFKMMP